MLAGRTTNNDETTVGVVIVHAADQAAAQGIMERDPFVKSGLMSATLFPFGVAYGLSNFARARSRLADWVRNACKFVDWS